MAMTFQEKVDLIGKYKDKNDKFASVYKYGKNIDSPKLNDEQKEKVRKNVEVAYNAIKQMQEKKPTKTATAKGGAKKKTMLGLASEIKKRDNVSWDEAKKRAKRDYESERKKLEKEEKQQLADFKKQVGKIKFVRATTKTDINKDKVIPALPSGKRYPKRGKTTNKWGTFNNNPKKPYWENRANRMDVNQPSKSVYPKLAKGGKFNDNLYFDQLASMSATRAVAVKEWASANNLSNDDLLNIIQGLGRKQITPTEFVGAVLGNKNDTSKIVSYAKEGKGFKMAKGGKIIDQYDGRTPEDVWNNLSKSQRQHFLYDHIEEIQEYKGIKEQLPSSEIIKAYNSDWKTLDKDIKNRFANHTREGQYAKGGEVGKEKTVNSKNVEYIISLVPTGDFTNTYNLSICRYSDEFGGSNHCVMQILSKSEAEIMFQKVNESNAENMYRILAKIPTHKNKNYAKGGEVSVYNLKKGDKVETRNGKIETIIRKTGSGSYETEENDYTHSPESLKFVSRPSRKMANGGTTKRIKRMGC